MQIYEGYFVVLNDFLSGGMSYGRAIFEIGTKMDTVNGWDRWWIKTGYSLDVDGAALIRHGGGFWMNERDFDRILCPEDIYRILFKGVFEDG